MKSVAMLAAAVVVAAFLTNGASAQIIITEIADKGSSNTCNGNGRDWIELYNAGKDDVDLGASGYMLHDDTGPTSATAPRRSNEQLIPRVPPATRNGSPTSLMPIRSIRFVAMRAAHPMIGSSGSAANRERHS